MVFGTVAMKTIGGKSSNDWKNGRNFFQRLEKPEKKVPTIGILVLAAVLLLAPLLSPARAGDGDALMMQLRAALPYIPLRIRGDLQTRDRRGNIVRVNPVEMRVDWGAEPPTALYMVHDRFGNELERLQIAWPPGDAPEYTYAQGDPPVETDLEDLNRSIAGLDLDWADLSLSFLWWDGARVIGSERVRGRYCTIVELPAPEDQVSQYAFVRLWIDPEINLLMQADAYDARRRLARRMQVKSLRKIDEVWMIQNLDIFSGATGERVTLRVRDLKALDDSFEAEYGFL